MIRGVTYPYTDCPPRPVPVLQSVSHMTELVRIASLDHEVLDVSELRLVAYRYYPVELQSAIHREWSHYDSIVVSSPRLSCQSL